MPKLTDMLTKKVSRAGDKCKFWNQNESLNGQIVWPQESYSWWLASFLYFFYIIIIIILWHFCFCLFHFLFNFSYCILHINTFLKLSLQKRRNNIYFRLQIEYKCLVSHSLRLCRREGRSMDVEEKIIEEFGNGSLWIKSQMPKIYSLHVNI